MSNKEYNKPSQGILKKELSDLAYRVTQGHQTEPPFSSAYVKSPGKGIYVDVATGEPLFLSSDQFDAGCGWPSFTKPIRKDVIKTHKDFSHGMIRTEVRSQMGESHLGHVFDDGPKESGGLRYCINGAALKFVAYEDLEALGYEAIKSYLDEDI